MLFMSTTVLEQCILRTQSAYPVSSRDTTHEQKGQRKVGQIISCGSTIHFIFLGGADLSAFGFSYETSETG